MRHNYATGISMTIAALLMTIQLANAQGAFSKKATDHEDRNHFVDASRTYQGLFEKGSREASLQAARNLYKGRRYEDALKLYEHADSLGIITDADEVFRYFECLKSVKRYEDADGIVRARIKDFQDRPEFGLNDGKISYYNKLSSFKGVELKQAGLNSKFSDISPTLYDGWIYFVSTRPFSGNNKVHRINMQPFYNLYAVPVESDMKTTVKPVGAFGKPEGKIKLNDKSGKSLPNGINKKYHDGPVQVVPSGNLLFFTTNHTDVEVPKEKKGKVNLRIYYSEKQGNIWTTPKEIPSNSFDYSNQHAWYDEKSATLWFSSNRPGGKGGYDIWKMKRNADGSWSEAENAGEKVNTPKTEVFPGLTPDGQLLFASNGWPGLGGLDVFMQDADSDQPLNLMAGINSEKDDFGLYFTSRNEGFLGSNREGTQGDDDIWQFTMEWDVKTVRKYNATGGKVMIAAMDGATQKGVSVGVRSVEEGTGKVTASGNAGPQGESFELTVGEMLTISAEGYEPLSVKVTEDMILGKSFSPGLKALPDYKEGPVAVIIRDKATGKPLEGGYIQSDNTVMSAGQISQDGAVVPMRAGSKLQLEAQGYNPVSFTVTQELIRAGRMDQTLELSKDAGKPVKIMVTNAAKSAPIGAEMSILRSGIATTRMIAAEGSSVNLLPGDQVSVSSPGFTVKTQTLTRADFTKPSLNFSLSPDPALVKTAAGGNTQGGSDDKMVQVRILENQKFIIYFNFDRFSIRKDAAEILAKVAYVLLEEYELAEVLLTGHTDTRGSYAYNEQLSRNRVNAAKKWLIDKGVDPKRIRTDYHGELKLAKICPDATKGERNTDQCLTSEEHQLNRRVELEILNAIIKD